MQLNAIITTFRSGAGSSRTFDPASLRSIALVGLVVFVACVFGILTRPVGQLASFWPANAVLLGLLVQLRQPRLVHWLAATGAYLLADALSGSPLDRNLILNAANLLGVSVGFALLSRFASDDTGLQRPESVLRMLLIVAAASAAAGLAGAFIYPMLFGGTALDGWKFWFATELVNYIAILPVLLTWPVERRQNRPGASGTAAQRPLLPVLVVALSCVAGHLIGGPGAVIYPVPALLWCALFYNLFTIALLTLAYSAWALTSIEFGVLQSLSGLDGWDAIMSLRLGITLVAIGPLIVASVSYARNGLLNQLRDMAMIDQLTGAVNRRTFHELAERLLAAPAGKGPLALLMLDIDHFKTINDTLGHAVGDRELCAFVSAARHALPPGIELARLGGEEFAVLLPGTDRDTAEAIADTIRAAIEEQQLQLEDRRTVSVTVSIGLAVSPRLPARIEPLLAAADEALYRAKAAGRNRVETSELSALPPAAAAAAYAAREKNRAAAATARSTAAASTSRCVTQRCRLLP